MPERLHLRWQLLGLGAMFAASLLPRDMARRAGILLGFAMLAALMLVPLVGTSVNGAQRWLNLGVSLQPSEFLKPAFAIGLAWILSWRVRDPNLPVMRLSLGLMALVAVLLMMQPDFGSTLLFGCVWFALMLLSGLEMRKIMLAGAGGVAALVAANALLHFALALPLCLVVAWLSFVTIEQPFLRLRGRFVGENVPPEGNSPPGANQFLCEQCDKQLSIEPGP